MRFVSTTQTRIEIFIYIKISLSILVYESVYHIRDLISLEIIPKKTASATGNITENSTLGLTID